MVISKSCGKIIGKPTPPYWDEIEIGYCLSKPFDTDRVCQNYLIGIPHKTLSEIYNNQISYAWIFIRMNNNSNSINPPLAAWPDSGAGTADFGYAIPEFGLPHLVLLTALGISGWAIKRRMQNGVEFKKVRFL